MTATIIIPAHNEETNIKCTLETLQPKKFINDFSIIVVCNGCNDKTAEIVETHFPDVHCIEIKEASKSLAIRNAETLNENFPRIYLDADIKLTGQEAISIISSAKNHPDKISMPASKMNFTNVNVFVKLYYKHWYQTCYVKELGYGCGVYALSEEGRHKFGIWPNLISDDGFVREFFSLKQVNLIDNVHVEVNAPKNIFSLIKIKIRSKYGRLELVEHFSKNNIKLKNKTFSTPTPRFSFIKINYYAINIIAFLFAKILFQIKALNGVWLTDNSNR